MGNEKHYKNIADNILTQLHLKKIIKLLTLCNSLVLLLDYRSFLLQQEKRRNHTMKKLRYEEKAKFFSIVPNSEFTTQIILA